MTLEKRKIILVFEDDDKQFETINKELRKHLTEKEVLIEQFKLTNEEKKAEKVLSTKIVEKRISKNKNGSVELVVIDTDLTKYPDVDLNEPTIANECKRHNVPYCVYNVDTTQKIEKLKSWQDEGINLISRDPELIARQCVGVYHGFDHIKNTVKGIVSKTFLGPTEIVSNVMGAPKESKSQIALYLESYYKMVPSEQSKETEFKNYITPLLGYIVYNSILRFPGVVLNETAAASYLDIKVSQFSNPKTQKYFKDALYTGPFNELGPYWWKEGLDKLLAEVKTNSEKNQTGRDFIRKKGLTKIERCRCEDKSSRGHLGAGYVCVITNTPVCAKHSKGSISWLPRGATLARISNSEWDELGPWFSF